MPNLLVCGLAGCGVATAFPHADELHDALTILGFISEDEIEAGELERWQQYLAELQQAGRAGRLEPLGWIYTTPGFTDERIHLFAAFDLEEVPARPDDDEHIETLEVPLSRALEWVWRGEIPDAKSALALLHAARRFGPLAR